MKWQPVALMLLVIALLISNLNWRTTHAIGGHLNGGWVVRGAINVAVLLALFRARRYFPR